VSGFLRRVGRRAERLVFPDSHSADEHWQRVVMIESVDAYIAALPPESVSAVEISGDTHAGKPWREFTTLDYPEFDLCAPLEEQRRFDVVICEQVLEHVEDPWAAAANLRGLCTPGGRVIVSTPFLIKLHEVRMFMMKDYWRFTPRGLRTLLERVGLEVEEVQSWGNRECVVGNFTHWSAYRRWLPLRNEPDFPVQVWAFARNPG
jgi:SAM-dependent methyltransferase